MATPQRLPIVNSDDGVWGDIIRQYIKKEHYDDGTDNPVNGGHQNITVRAGTATAGTSPIKLTTGTLLTAAESGAIEFNTDSLYFTITTGTARRKVAMYDDTAGATGDLYYRNSSGTFTRLAAGNTNQTLRISSGSPTWTNNAPVTTPGTGTSYTVTTSDTVVFADAGNANVTITLPSASGLSGYRFYVKRIDNGAYSCTIGGGGNTIDGQANYTLDTQYTSILVVSNGANWFIL